MQLSLVLLLLAPVLHGHPRNPTTASVQASAGETPAAKAEEKDPMPDRPADAFRLELLDLACEAASAIPVDPMIKDRCRVQEEVVMACLELDQPRRALRTIEGIENWRKGVAFAELAYYCADHGHVGEVQQYLDLAEQAARKAVADQEQDWRVDRIRATIAKTHLTLGQVEQAASFEAGLEQSEVGRVLAAKAVYLDAEGFEGLLKGVDQVVAAYNFDQVKNALDALVPVFDRFYEDENRRERVQDKVLSSWTKLPHEVRLDLALALAGVAVAHGDPANARILLEQGSKVVEGFHATIEFRVPMLAKLARTRFRAGDEEAARRDADAALAEFEQGKDELVDFRRPDALRPVAEAYQAMGHAQAALMVYKRAVAEGATNQNPRPRAEDLVSTCCSMARSGAQPDEALLKQMQEIRSGLRAPW